MSERDPIWDDLKRHSKEKFDADRAKFLDQAIRDDDGSWTKHTQHHWSRKVGDKRLDYWPSRKKWMVDNKVNRGLKSMYQFIQSVSFASDYCE